MNTAISLHRVKHCRSCGSANLVDLISFGETPIADRLMSPGDGGPEIVAPLTLTHCLDCALCQIRETLPPEALFPANYPYYSSVSPALVAHFQKSADTLATDLGLGADQLVVEAASNDGYMLQMFREHGIATLGIDPAEGPVQVARDRGIETIHEFFGADLARDLASQGRQADLFLANNVLAHVADTNDFVAGIADILAPKGVAVIEAPYLLDLVGHGAFDTIYHQHLLYFSLTALVPLFARHGLHLNDAERTKVHGGSLRLFISRAPDTSVRLKDLLGEERRRDVASVEFYDRFLSRIAGMRRETMKAISALKLEGRRIAGYGAAAKATTLLHYFGLGPGDIDFIIDKSPWKQGLEMPGTRIPIVAPERLQSDRPDAILILAWNFANEIVAENQSYAQSGGRFLVPVPEFREVTGELAGVSL